MEFNKSVLYFGSIILIFNLICTDRHVHVDPDKSYAHLVVMVNFLLSLKVPKKRHRKGTALFLVKKYLVSLYYQKQIINFINSHFIIKYDFLMFGLN